MVCMYHGRLRMYRELNRSLISLAIRRFDSVVQCLGIGYFATVSSCAVMRYLWLSRVQSRREAFGITRTCTLGSEGGEYVWPLQLASLIAGKTE
eukprot:1948734-Pleurochrysis_carterae.AAC.2